MSAVRYEWRYSEVEEGTMTAIWCPVHEHWYIQENHRNTGISLYLPADTPKEELQAKFLRQIQFSMGKTREMKFFE